MRNTDYEQLENLFLALSDKTRLRLLTLMADGEVAVGYLAESLGESQPKISRHLAYLRNAGLVTTRRDGKWIYYGIDVPTYPTAADVLRAALGVEQETAPKPTLRSETPLADEYVPHPVEVAYDEYEDTAQDDWQPEELDVFLL